MGLPVGVPRRRVPRVPAFAGASAAGTEGWTERATSARALTLAIAAITSTTVLLREGAGVAAVVVIIGSENKLLYW